MYGLSNTEEIVVNSADALDGVVPEATRRRIWSACLWCWPVCLVGFAFCFVIVAGFVPPPRESWSAQRIAQFYADNRTAIRVGLIGSMFFSALMVPFFTVISAEIRKIEGRVSMLAPIQFAGAVILVMFFQLIGLFWLLSSFRPEADPQIIRLTNDFCWLVWTILIPTYSLQFVCIAIAGLLDARPSPAFPRWSAYMNLWVAITGAGGVMAVFFKTGPFSWNGIVGFWIPVVAFLVGMSVNMVLLLRRTRYESSPVTNPGRAQRPDQATSSGTAVGAAS
jgi:hypothetical protein